MKIKKLSAIFGTIDAEGSEPVDFWFNKGSMDNFHLIMPKSLAVMIRVDRVNLLGTVYVNGFFGP